VRSKLATSGLACFLLVSSAIVSCAPGEGPPPLLVKETEYELAPAEIVVNAPDFYTFAAENSGREVHALAIRGQNLEEVRSEDLNPGESGELQVDLEAGTYEIYCPLDGHEERGMKGTVTVDQG